MNYTIGMYLWDTTTGEIVTVFSPQTHGSHIQVLPMIEKALTIWRLIKEFIPVCVQVDDEIEFSKGHFRKLKSINYDYDSKTKYGGYYAYVYQHGPQGGEFNNLRLRDFLSDIKGFTNLR